MPTSGPLTIDPIPGFFAKIETMFSPHTAARFRLLREGHNGENWNNDTKRLTSTNHFCEVCGIGKPMHVWKYDPSLIEGWATLTACETNGGGIFVMPDLDLPSGSGYNFTFSCSPPLTLQGLAAFFSNYWHSASAHAIRYGRLWSTVEPEMLLHGFHVIHFDGWLP